MIDINTITAIILKAEEKFDISFFFLCPISDAEVESFAPLPLARRIYHLSPQYSIRCRKWNHRDGSCFFHQRETCGAQQCHQVCERQ